MEEALSVQVKRKHGKISFDDDDDDDSKNEFSECRSSFKRMRTSEKGSVEDETQEMGVGSTGDAASSQHSLPQDGLPRNGSEWVELFVREVTSVSTIDDAKSRAFQLLEVFEKSILSNASMEAAGNSVMLKQELENLNQENTILKRAVSIQHDRQMGHDGMTQELQQLKQLVPQYQEKLRTLKVNNYALAMNLQQATQNNSMSGGHFPPDVF